MSSKVRVAMVGSGGMASNHLKSIGPMDDAEIVAFCDVSREKIGARIEELKGIKPDAAPQAFDDPATMIAEVDPDCVYLLLPPFVHGAAEHACLAAGKPFFVEKPIGLDAGRTREIASEVERKGLLTCAGYMNRYREGVNAAKERLASDPTVLAHGGWVNKSPNPQPGDTNIGSWWVQKDKSGGQLVEQVTHTFDIVRYVCGEVTEVCARAANGFNKGVYNYTIDDASSVVMQLAGGGVVNLMACCAANAGGGGIWLNVYAHQTTCLFSGWDHALKMLRVGQDAVEIKGEPDIFAVEDAAFLQAVRSGDASSVKSSYPDAAKTLLVTLAANESIATGKPVSLG